MLKRISILILSALMLSGCASTAVTKSVPDYEVLYKKTHRNGDNIKGCTAVFDTFNFMYITTVTGGGSTYVTLNKQKGVFSVLRDGNDRSINGCDKPLYVKAEKHHKVARTGIYKIVNYDFLSDLELFNGEDLRWLAQDMTYLYHDGSGNGMYKKYKQMPIFKYLGEVDLDRNDIKNATIKKLNEYEGLDKATFKTEYSNKKEAKRLADAEKLKLKQENERLAQEMYKESLAEAEKHYQKEKEIGSIVCTWEGLVGYVEAISPNKSKIKVNFKREVLRKEGGYTFGHWVDGKSMKAEYNYTHKSINDTRWVDSNTIGSSATCKGILN